MAHGEVYQQGGFRKLKRGQRSCHLGTEASRQRENTPGRESREEKLTTSRSNRVNPLRYQAMVGGRNSAKRSS
jgi:hypothetical protein